MGKKITEIKNLKKKQHVKCSICYQKIARSTISCTHKFCLHCITRWAKKKLNCPLCRKQFDTIIYGKRQYKYTLPVQPKRLPITRNLIQPYIVPWSCIIYWKPIYWLQTTQTFLQSLIPNTYI